jgi:hypothetical protein
MLLFSNILNSICINYKTWFLYIVLSYIICDYHWITGFLCFLYSYFACYLGHRLMHTDIFYCNMYSLSHCHHHRNSNEMFGHVMNCLTEFLSLANNIVMKYICDVFQLVNIFFIDIVQYIYNSFYSL